MIDGIEISLGKFYEHFLINYLFILLCFFLPQSAALYAVTNVYEYIDEISIRRMVLPKIKAVFEKNQSDLKIMANVLQCIERTLDKLDKSQVSYSLVYFNFHNIFCVSSGFFLLSWKSMKNY